MLTLTRKPGEAIYIGDDIEIVVKEIRGGAVRLGIQAPSGILILRGELYRKTHPLEETNRAVAEISGESKPHR